MPYEQRWVPAPTDMSIKVIAGNATSPPDGTTLEDNTFGMAPYPRAVKKTPFVKFYHCRQCEGWIEGYPSEFRVNTLGVLSGRQGVDFHCRRCGDNIGFEGRRS